MGSLVCAPLAVPECVCACARAATLPAPCPGQTQVGTPAVRSAPQRPGRPDPGQPSNGSRPSRLAPLWVRVRGDACVCPHSSPALSVEPRPQPRPGLPYGQSVPAQPTVVQLSPLLWCSGQAVTA